MGPLFPYLPTLSPYDVIVVAVSLTRFTSVSPHWGASGKVRNPVNRVPARKVLRTGQGNSSRGSTTPPCLNGTTTPGVLTHKGSPPRVHLNHNRAHHRHSQLRDAQVAPLGKTRPLTRRRPCPIDSTLTTHTPKTHAKMSPVWSSFRHSVP